MVVEDSDDPGLVVDVVDVDVVDESDGPALVVALEAAGSDEPAPSGDVVARAVDEPGPTCLVSPLPAQAVRLRPTARQSRRTGGRRRFIAQCY